jgi:hypothetical protein
MTALYTPEQDRVVERRNQTIMGMAHNMLKAIAMMDWLCGEAVASTVYILN